MNAINKSIPYAGNNIQVSPIRAQQIINWRVSVNASRLNSPSINKGKALNYLAANNLMIPTTFDWRDKVGGDGKKLLMPTLDQQNCGSCYAFCSTQMLSHRLSIKTNGLKKVRLSVQDIVTCGPKFIDENFINPIDGTGNIEKLINEKKIVKAGVYVLQQCNGGLLSSVANYLVMNGVTSEESVPYANASFSDISGSTNYCQDTKYERYFAESAHSLVAGVENGLDPNTIVLPKDVLDFNIENMQLAIMKEGPIITALNVFTDFFYYPNNGDVYISQPMVTINGQSFDCRYEGGHAVVVVGWGEKIDSSGEKLHYWIAQNSWGSNWGLNGYFYIKRGINMCNFEMDSIEVIPNLLKSPSILIIPSTSSSNPPTYSSMPPTNLKKNRSLYIVLIVVILLLLFTGGVFLIRKKQ